MRLTLAVPRLFALDRAALSTLPALGRLAHYAGSPTVASGDIDLVLASARNPGAASPVAPLAALGAGFDPGESYVLRADPVSLVAGRNDIALAGRVDDLDADEAAALIATLNAHFAGDGLVFRAPRPDAWFVMAREPPALSTTPLACVRGAMHRHLPTGDDASRWRRWMSEMQMLLHEHPAGRTRAARAQSPVTGIWLSGGGTLSDVRPASAPAVFTGDGPGGDVARGLARFHGGVPQPLPGSFATLPARQDAIVVLDEATDLAAAVALANAWLAPAVAALERGRLATLQLVADGSGLAASWRALRPSTAARLVGRIRRPAFVPPTPPEDDA
jgi:hypothetical protein